jgi:hypothetical protein
VCILTLQLRPCRPARAVLARPSATRARPSPARRRPMAGAGRSSDRQDHHHQRRRLMMMSSAAREPAHVPPQRRYGALPALLPSLASRRAAAGQSCSMLEVGFSSHYRPEPARRHRHVQGESRAFQHSSTDSRLLTVREHLLRCSRKSHRIRGGSAPTRCS